MLVEQDRIKKHATSEYSVLRSLSPTTKELVMEAPELGTPEAVPRLLAASLEARLGAVPSEEGSSARCSSRKTTQFKRVASGSQTCVPSHLLSGFGGGWYT